MDNELLEIYLQFNSKNYNYLSQLDKENLVKVLILNICQSNDLTVPEIYFNKEEQGVNGSFYCIDEPFINIHIEPGITPYHLLKTIIHETYHYQQYCFNINKENEIINGLKNPVNYDPFYFIQEHEVDARDYTSKQLAEAAKVISDPEFNKLMQQDILDDEMAMKRYHHDIINKIPILNLVPSIEKMNKFNHFLDMFIINQERKTIIKYTDLISKYLSPHINNQYEYYDFFSIIII